MTERYSKIAVLLHWLIALLIAGAYAAILYRHELTSKGTPENVTAFQVHIACGISVGLFVLLRVIWRLTHRPPAPLPGAAWERLGARIMHWLLYFFMIAMPLTGYLSTKSASKYLMVIPGFPETGLYRWLVTDTFGLSWKSWHEPLETFHHISGENVVWVLIVLHISAAFYHQFLKRDALMRRMWF